MNVMDDVSYLQPDILCFPENFPLPRTIDLSTATTVPGHLTQEIGDKARQHNMYVIAPLIEADRQKFYNTAVLIGRDGEIVGKYRKIHPTIGEMKAGITPGTGQEVFKTDFGNVGIIICFDVQYPQLVQNLARKGAEVIFFPAEFPAQTYLRGLAWQYAVNFVSSTLEPGAEIVDLTGTVLAMGGGRGGEVQEMTPRDQAYSKNIPVISATMNLDVRRFEIDFNLEKVKEIQKKYGRKLDIRIFRNDDELVIASLSEDLPLSKVIEEYGLEPISPYLQRSESMLEKSVEEKPLPSIAR